MRLGSGPGRSLPVSETLRTALGSPTVIRRLSSSPRSRVWLAEFSGEAAIVKQITGGGDTGERYARELTALRLARRVRPYVVPDVLGADPDAHVLVLEHLAWRLETAGEYALLHGDPCPDNAVHTSDGIRFVDLEQAALGGGYHELAYLRIGFPTCWCAASVPAAVLDQAEAAYRSTWRAMTGTDQRGDLADACAGWLIRGDALVERARRGQPGQLARLAREDWRWGTATARQRLLHRLTTVAALGADHPELTSVTEVSSAMRDRILARWPGIRPLPVAEGNPLGNA